MVSVLVILLVGKSGGKIPPVKTHEEENEFGSLPEQENLLNYKIQGGSEIDQVTLAKKPAYHNNYVHAFFWALLFFLFFLYSALKSRSNNHRLGLSYNPLNFNLYHKNALNE